MSLSVKGKLSSKLSVESGTSKAGKEWKKQSFVVDTGAQYNPEICFQLFGEDKIEMLNHHNEGDQVEVSFNLSISALTLALAVTWPSLYILVAILSIFSHKDISSSYT